MLLHPPEFRGGTFSVSVDERGRAGSLAGFFVFFSFPPASVDTYSWTLHLLLLYTFLHTYYTDMYQVPVLIPILVFASTSHVSQAGTS